jgi:hypothetical protein
MKTTGGVEIVGGALGHSEKAPTGRFILFD